MYSERINDGIERNPEQYFKRYNAKHPERGGAKKHNIQGTQTERKEALKALRNRWEQMHNAHIDRRLPKNTLLNASRNHRAKISMKSLAEQGITDRKPEPHMTPSESAAKHREAAAIRKAAHDVQAVWQERAAMAARKAAEQEAVAKAEQGRKERERETRQKILLGALCMHKIQNRQPLRADSWADWKNELDGFLTKKADRVLFDLPELPEIQNKEQTLEQCDLPL
jgi:hypothetical protein